MRDTLLSSLQWRYATKSFDREKEIPAEDWAALEEALRLTPSSYGLQPWKFFVIRNQELKDSLVSASYGQGQVAECSHLLVITVKRTLGQDDVDHWIEVIAETRGVTIDSLAFFRNMILGDVVNGPRSVDGLGWAKLQAYIALGNFMTCAALLGIDCCPMEGFVSERYDGLLGLAERGLTTAVVCPTGYRTATDKHALTPKARFGREEVIETIL
jgi:nitroreductase